MACLYQGVAVGLLSLCFVAGANCFAHAENDQLQASLELGVCLSLVMILCTAFHLKTQVSVYNVSPFPF